MQRGLCRLACSLLLLLELFGGQRLLWRARPDPLDDHRSLGGEVSLSGGLKPCGQFGLCITAFIDVKPFALVQERRFQIDALPQNGRVSGRTWVRDR